MIVIRAALRLTTAPRLSAHVAAATRTALARRCATTDVAINASPVQPSYTVTDAPVIGAAAGKKWGKFVLRSIKGHTKKLNPVARQVVGQGVNEAMAQMAFHSQKRGGSMKTALERAVWNADFYHNLRSDDLMVEEAWTGKHLTSPRIRHHNKGRAGRSHYRTSMLTVRLREMSAEEKESLNKFKWLPSAESRAKLDPRGY